MTKTISFCTIEDPTDLMSKVDALKEAVDAAMQTFKVQFEMELELDGMPGTPSPQEVAYGSTIPLTNDTINYQYACAFDETTANSLTRTLFAMEPDEDVTMEDMSDALNEIPNVAAGVWKAKREAANESYQLGLPLFMQNNSWITYFPRGVNAISQKLRGPEDVQLQVILIWQYGEQAGGNQQMTTKTESASEAIQINPADVLTEAVDSVVQTCSIQMDYELQVKSNPSDPRDADVEFGSSIALTAANGGGWQLAVMADKACCEGLTRALFAMEPDEAPTMDDMADAIGEIVNVAAGVMKSSRAKAGQAVQLGLPLFLEGKSCIEFFASGIQGMAQTVVGKDGQEAHVILIWQEG